MRKIDFLFRPLELDGSAAKLRKKENNENGKQKKTM